MRQKLFDGNSWYSPLLSINFFATGKFLKHGTEGFPFQTFQQCDTKSFRRTLLILPLPHSYPKTVSLPKLFWNTSQMGSPTKFFGIVRQKIFDGNSWYSPPPLIHKLFRYQRLSETQHRSVALRNGSVLWDKTLSTEKGESPFLIPNIFQYPKLMKH